MKTDGIHCSRGRMSWFDCYACPPSRTTPCLSRRMIRKFSGHEGYSGQKNTFGPKSLLPSACLRSLVFAKKSKRFRDLGSLLYEVGTNFHDAGSPLADDNMTEIGIQLSVNHPDDIILNFEGPYVHPEEPFFDMRMDHFDVFTQTIHEYKGTKNKKNINFEFYPREHDVMQSFLYHHGWKRVFDIKRIRLDYHFGGNTINIPETWYQSEKRGDFIFKIFNDQGKRPNRVSFIFYPTIDGIMEDEAVRRLNEEIPFDMKTLEELRKGFRASTIEKKNMLSSMVINSSKRRDRLEELISEEIHNRTLEKYVIKEEYMNNTINYVKDRATEAYEHLKNNTLPDADRERHRRAHIFSYYYSNMKCKECPHNGPCGVRSNIGRCDGDCEFCKIFGVPKS